MGNVSLADLRRDDLIVGRPLEVHEGIIIATMTCKCKPNNPPLLIRGVDLLVICRECHNQYAIRAVKYSRDAQDPGIAVMVAQYGKHDSANDGQTSDNPQMDGTTMTDRDDDRSKN